MPKQVEPKASPWLCETKGELADRLGLGRNTPSAWQQADPPAPAELCEFQWRMWAAANGRELQKDPADRKLLEQLAAAGVAHYKRLLEARPATAAASLTLDPTAGLEEQKRVLGYLDVQRQLQEHHKAARQLVAQAEVVAAMKAVGLVFDRQLAALAEPSRETMPVRIATVRAKMQAEVLAELQKLVEPAP